MSTWHQRKNPVPHCLRENNPGAARYARIVPPSGRG
jgi:hypothetical protein